VRFYEVSFAILKVLQEIDHVLQKIKNELRLHIRAWTGDISISRAIEKLEINTKASISQGTKGDLLKELNIHT